MLTAARPEVWLQALSVATGDTHRPRGSQAATRAETGKPARAWRPLMPADAAKEHEGCLRAAGAAGGLVPRVYPEGESAKLRAKPAENRRRRLACRERTLAGHCSEQGHRWYTTLTETPKPPPAATVPRSVAGGCPRGPSRSQGRVARTAPRGKSARGLGKGRQSCRPRGSGHGSRGCRRPLMCMQGRRLRPDFTTHQQVTAAPESSDRASGSQTARGQEEAGASVPGTGRAPKPGQLQPQISRATGAAPPGPDPEGTRPPAAPGSLAAAQSRRETPRTPHGEGASST